MRVMIAEDLALLRDGLVRLLRDNGFDVVAAVENGEALVAAVSADPPDIAVLDVRLPPTNGTRGCAPPWRSADVCPGCRC